MSSPFDTFRKHRTYWMAGLVLLAILAFIVAPGIESLMSLMRSNEGTHNEVVVRWSDGKVTLAALDATRRQHNQVTRFLQALAKEVVKAGGMPKVPGFRYDAAQKRVQDLGLPVLDTNRAVCQTMIISQRARQLGIDFDEAVIDDFFTRFCDNRIDDKDFQRILRETCGRELSLQALRRQLGVELSAVVMERIALAGVNYEGSPLVTPGSLWQNYLQLNQAARIEAYPVLVSEFVKDVKATPTESEIRAIYEEGSGNFPSPNSPEPGFRRRYQAELEYVYGSWNKLIEVEKAKITPEALKAEYDRLVAQGGLQVPIDPPKLPETPTTPSTPDAKQPAEGDKPAGDKPAGDKPLTATKPDEGTPPAPGAETSAKPEEPKAEEPKTEKPAEKPSEDKPTDAKPSPEKPAEEKPTEEKPADEKPAEEKPADPKSQSRLDKARLDNDGQVRLVSFAQDNNQPPPVQDPSADPAADKPAADKPAADKPATETAVADKPADAPASDKPASDKPATDKPATDAPATDAPATDKPAGDKPASTPDLGAAAGVTSDKPGTMPMRTKTFEEAKDDVARSMAMNVVREQLQGKLTKIETEMARYSSDLQVERVSLANNMKPENPIKPIDLKKLAEAEGLQYGITGMSDGFRLANTPVGRSMIGNQSLVNSIMNQGFETYRPVRSMFIDMGNSTEPDFQEFVSWKTKDQPAYTPEISQVRDEVIDAWRSRQARKLASDQANAIAEKLRKAGAEPWKTVLDTQQQTLLINPTPFTWMSPPREMFSPAQITFVQGLDSVGGDFMQKVFNTPAGQVAVAPNAGLNTYYVVRVVELTPTVEVLRQNFETSRGRARQLAFPERERMFSDWYQNIERSLNVQWLAADEMLVN